VIKYQQEFLCLAEQEVTPLAELEWEESGHPTETLVIDNGNVYKCMLKEVDAHSIAVV
jgi:hypothetical protein